MSFNQIYDIASSAMRAQSVRMNTVASNLANADSAASSAAEVYHAIKPVFVSEYQLSEDSFQMLGASVGVYGVTETTGEATQRYEPDHPFANEEGYVYYSNVNPVEEMADMMSASRSFETAVQIIGRTNSMQQSLLRLGQ
jgi:flagellar basal-body rod protein FlgC